MLNRMHKLKSLLVNIMIAGNPECLIGCGGCHPQGAVYHPPQGPVVGYNGGQYAYIMFGMIYFLHFLFSISFS